MGSYVQYVGDNMSALNSAWVFIKTKTIKELQAELDKLLQQTQDNNKNISLGISGSRNLQNYDAFKSKLDEWVETNGKPNQMVSGGQTGADSFAKRYAEENDIPFVEHHHDYPRYRDARPNKYYARNMALVNDSTHLLAFPSSYSRGRNIGRDWEKTKGGTQWTMRYAQQQGIPVNYHWMEDIE